MKLLVILAVALALIPVSITAHMVVIDVPYPDVAPFQSYEQLEQWVDNYELTLHLFLPIRKIDCEDYAISMVLNARQDGYLLLTDRDANNHLWVMAPVFAENRFYYIDAETRTLYKYFQGAEWRID